MGIFLLYIITVLIWGSTWLAIKLQLGVVEPMVSVFYRFILAALILFVICRVKRLKMRFTFKEHLFMLLQGSLLFSVAYWLVYVAETHLASGLVAVVTSGIIFMNILNGAIFLRNKIHYPVFLGAVSGLIGIVLIFSRELSTLTFSNTIFSSLILINISNYVYSLGNITSARNQKNGIPVMQSNAYSMLYGALVMLLLILIAGKSFTFDPSPVYVGTLLYLSIFGSVIAFGCYLTLIGRIGPERAAYSPLVVPVIALGLSALFEGYAWSFASFSGLFLIVFGNVVVLRKADRSP